MQNVLQKEKTVTVFEKTERTGSNLAHERPTRAGGDTFAERPTQAGGDAAPERLPHIGRRLYDMHCHLDFAANGAELAAAAQADGLAAFSTTVDPRSYEQACEQFAPWDAVHVGLGLHPWWMADGRCGAEEAALFMQLAQDARLIGEVGLDFSPRREGTFEHQRSMFARFMAACTGGGRLFSIHAVRSASVVLDVLEETGSLAGSVAILHWFSGSGDELARAVRLGCRFSLGSRMLETKRGRAYARSLPANRLLLESDLPNDPGDVLPFDLWQADLGNALHALAEARGTEPNCLREQLAANSAACFAAAR